MAADRHLPGILRLTPEVRHWIYLDAGLGQKEYYDHSAPHIYELGDPRNLEPVHPRRRTGFHGLLLSCRTIYLEASALLYSENRFIVRYQPFRTLSSLRALSPHALASLTDLKIVLNQASCHAQGSENGGYGYCCGRGRANDSEDQWKVGDPGLLRGCLSSNHEYIHDLALDASSPLVEEVLSEWQTTAFYLASHIIPGKLDLSLVCDVWHRDVQIATRVLDGLFLLPRLKNCHVRLSERRDKLLQHITQRGVFRARGIISPEHPLPPGLSSSPDHLDPFRLLDLPREIRLRILEYTDLVTPSKEVMWHRNGSVSGYYVQRAPCHHYEGPGFCVPDCGGACRFSSCWQSPWKEPSIGCFCCLQHTAASTRCRCWATPTSLFLICRTIYSEANLIFYSQNRFIIVDSPSSDPWGYWDGGDYQFETFAASQFLRRVIPQHCLGYLRFIELTFSQFTPEERPRDGHPALLDWDDTIDWLKDKLSLRVLTLRLVVTGNTDFVRGSRRSYEWTREQGHAILATYNRILLPLQLLGTAPDGGLARFYAVLPWPLKWSRLARDQIDDNGLKWLEAKDAELKRRAEKFVMGDRYESVSLATVEPGRSVWDWGKPRY